MELLCLFIHILGTRMDLIHTWPGQAQTHLVLARGILELPQWVPHLTP